MTFNLRIEYSDMSFEDTAATGEDLFEARERLENRIKDAFRREDKPHPNFHWVGSIVFVNREPALMS